MPSLLIMLILWIVLGLVTALAAQLVDRKDPPHGLGADYLAGVISAVVVGIADRLILPPLGFKPGPVAFAIEVTAPIAGAALVLGLMRYLKRRGE